MQISKIVYENFKLKISASPFGYCYITAIILFCSWMSEIKYFIPLIKIILLILFFLIIHIDKMIHIKGDKI